MDLAAELEKHFDVTVGQKEVWLRASGAGRDRARNARGSQRQQVVNRDIWERAGKHPSTFFLFGSKRTHTQARANPLRQSHGGGATVIHLLEKAGDVVFAAGGPGERVGVGRYVSRHQPGRLMALGAAGVANAVVVHSEAETHKTGR